LELVYKYDFIDGIFKIIELIFYNYNNSPIRSFTEFKNKIFFYNQSDKWKLMTDSDFDLIINYISKKLMNLFLLWQEDNKHRLQSTSYCIEYTDKLQKIIGEKYNKTTTRYKIKKYMYNKFTFVLL